MSDYVVNKFYREIFADLKVDREEAQELKDFFSKTNPPPDKLVKLRASAFRIGCEFLSEDRDSNVSLLRAINAIVHALEMTCMSPSYPPLGSFDQSQVEDKYKSIFEDLVVSAEENEDLMAFYKKDNPPPTNKLVWTRAAAFRLGCDYLSDDKNTNIKLLRAINVIVHCYETCCLAPKEYKLKMAAPQEENVESIGLDASIGKAVQHLWDLDVNRLTPDEDYSINVQKGKKPYQKHDAARDPLFTSIDSSVFRRPTYKTFLALLDNYEAETGIAEYVTKKERKEEYTFLKAIMRTGPMQFCHKYCRANKPDQVPEDEAGFIKLLHTIWFDLYRRSDKRDSSGFEHVFVGEIKDGSVSGFHNWIQFYLEEKRGNVDYRGYIKPRNKNDARTDENDHVLTIQFSWRGVEKMVGTSFVGVSPEFEMALYTTCFLVGKKDNKVELHTGTDIFDLNVKCYTMARHKIGTSYPEALSHEEA